MKASSPISSSSSLKFTAVMLLLPLNTWLAILVTPCGIVISPEALLHETSTPFSTVCAFILMHKSNAANVKRVIRCRLDLNSLLPTYIVVFFFISVVLIFYGSFHGKQEPLVSYDDFSLPLATSISLFQWQIYNKYHLLLIFTHKNIHFCCKSSPKRCK